MFTGWVPAAAELIGWANRTPAYLSRSLTTGSASVK
jgi:hypothetical protein